MSSCFPEILLIGYGNPGRMDDGLGPALAAKIEENPVDGIIVDADYQLTVEDSVDISKYEIVIFADAAVTGDAPFFFKKVHSISPSGISSHSVSPGEVLYLVETMFQAKTTAYVLGIRGYEFERFEERLSEGAKKNLEAAFEFIMNLVQSGKLIESAGSICNK